jgi:hypothetical protein
MSSEGEVIETTVAKVAAEVARRGLDPDDRVTITIEPDELIPGLRASRARVVAAGLTDASSSPNTWRGEDCGDGSDRYMVDTAQVQGGSSLSANFLVLVPNLTVRGSRKAACRRRSSIRKSRQAAHQRGNLRARDTSLRGREIERFRLGSSISQRCGARHPNQVRSFGFIII